jgi:hypothetical protein
MWTKIRDFFRDSETIFFARLQIFVGAAWEILSAADLSLVLPPTWMPYWLIGSGIVTEYLRRRRASDL